MKRYAYGYGNLGVHASRRSAFLATRTLVRACDVRPDIPPTARHCESWNVMPAV